MGALIRLLLWPFLRLRRVELAALPAGPRVYLCEHASLFDAAIVRACLPGKVISLVNPLRRGTFKQRLLSRLGGAVSFGDGPIAIEAALKAAENALESGASVCIFTEAKLSHPGDMPTLAEAVQRLAVARKLPVTPLHIAGGWGTLIGDPNHPAPLPLPRARFAKALLLHGAPVSEPTAANLRAAFIELTNEAWARRVELMQPMDANIIQGCRRRGRDVGFADPVRGAIPWIKVLTGAIAIARALRRPWDGQASVGFLLPPSVGGGLANLGAVLASRSVCNLNYTTGKEGMESACVQAGLKTVVTSKQFLHKAKLEAPAGVELIYLDDVAKTISTPAKLIARILAKLAPLWLIRRWVGAAKRHTVHDTLSLIFSSGSTGEPKGVPLTHANVLSNVEGADWQIQLGPRDRILHMLPFFHAFGNLLLWLGPHLGATLVFLPNPLDVESVGATTEKFGATILVATPTFMQMYMKKCGRAQFATLRLVVSGAEKLSQTFARAWHEKYGIAIFEGYGCTECAPVIACNAPENRQPGVFQPGNAPGAVGRPFPGVRVRIVDPDTGEPMPQGEPGMLLAKGPNVMSGYLGKPELTAAALSDGWYRTGDICKLNEDGTISITDRLSRFSKIGGEMVPHGKVEEALHVVIEATEQVFAVTAVPDEKKGERLAVLCCKAEIEIEVVIGKLQEHGLPNLFIPKPRDFVRVEALPLLGSGKMDLRAIKRIALEKLGA